MTELKRLCETDLMALAAVATGDAAALGRIQFSHFILINQLKNSLHNLEFLLKHLTGLNQAGSDATDSVQDRSTRLRAIDDRIIVSYPVFFRGIQDCRTFDLYKRYGVKWHALARPSVSAEQWAYMLRIGYVGATDAATGAGDSDSDSPRHARCGPRKPKTAPPRDSDSEAGDSTGEDDGSDDSGSETIDRRRVLAGQSLAVTVRVRFAPAARRRKEPLRQSLQHRAVVGERHRE